MSSQMIFKRYEIKYLLTEQQKQAVLKAMMPYMSLDKYGRSSIRNIYFDTDNYRLIRRSIERPVYKEKLRIRSYGKAQPEQAVFVELKKKYRSVVYKRRLAMPEKDAMEWLCKGVVPENSSQIAQEIEYFRKYYSGLHPAVFLSYEREAYYSRAGDDFRVTFDENILCREQSLSLESEAWGTPILGRGRTLMEIKTSGGIPLWMTRFLAEQEIFKASFSKYGTAYRNIIYPKFEGVRLYA